MRTSYVVSLWALTALAVLAAADESWSNCPAVCRCKWNSGRKTAGCANSSLTAVPANLSSQIQSIDLSHNALDALPPDAFRAVGLVNLHKLFLRACGVREVDRRAFAGLEILIELDLSWNAIQVLHPTTFRDNVRLRQVYVNHNPLRTLPDGIFNDLAFLQTVDASDCELARVGETAFAGVPKLHDLKLNNNNLTTIGLAAVGHVHSLVSLVLFGNPWLCNCDLQPFIVWAIHRNLYTPPTMCQEPEILRGKLWSELTAEDLACRPHVSVPSPVVEASEDNATLRCQSSGTPAPEMHWVFNSRIVGNASRKHLLAESVGSVRWLNLTVLSVGAQDAGDYVCVVKSPGGMEERSVLLKVLEGPERRSGAREGGYTTETWSLIVGLIAGSFILFVTASVFTFYFCCHKTFRANHEQSASSPVKRAACCDNPANADKFTAASSPTQKPQLKIDTSVITDDGTEMTHVKCSFLNNGQCQCSGVEAAEEKLAGDPTDCLTPDSTIPQEELFVTMAVADCRAYPPDLLPYPKRVAPGTPNTSTWAGRGAMSCSRSQTQFLQRPALAAEPSRWTGWGSADHLSIYDNLGPRATIDGSAAPPARALGVTHVGSQTCQGPGGLPSCQSTGGLSACQAHGGLQVHQESDGWPSCQAHSGAASSCQSTGMLSGCLAHGVLPACQATGAIPDCQSNGGLPACQAHGVLPTSQMGEPLPSCQSTGGLSICQAHGGLPTCQVAGAIPSCHSTGGLFSCQARGGLPACKEAGVHQVCQVHIGVTSCQSTTGLPMCQSTGRLQSCHVHSTGSWPCGPVQDQQLSVS